ncbi:MAG: hypothetical protein H6907_09500 [Hyphomicrobiales bacterium]|nr:hypothetical protein [Hyphomicrobiales bacterium]MCP5371954.1 hypothetical protein [Hyphomicrobiales bacterium]
MARIAVFTALWKRPSLSAYVLERWAVTAGDRVSLFAVGSEGAASRALAEEHGFTYFEAPNRPLSLKWQHLLRRVREAGPWDYVIRADSDDLFSADFAEAIVEACPADGACGLADIWVYDLARNALGYFPGAFHDGQGGHDPRYYRKAMGTGRCFSAGLLDLVDWTLWDEEIEQGLDGSLDQRLDGFNRRLALVSMRELGVFAVDVKTPANIWSFDDMRITSRLDGTAADSVLSAWGLGDLRRRVVP